MPARTERWKRLPLPTQEAKTIVACAVQPFLPRRRSRSWKKRTPTISDLMMRNKSIMTASKSIVMAVSRAILLLLRRKGISRPVTSECCRTTRPSISRCKASSQLRQAHQGRGATGEEIEERGRCRSRHTFRMTISSILRRKATYQLLRVRRPPRRELLRQLRWIQRLRKMKKKTSQLRAETRTTPTNTSSILVVLVLLLFCLLFCTMCAKQRK